MKIFLVILSFTFVLNDSFSQSQFQKSIGGSQRDEAHSMDITPDGGYVIAGNTLSFGQGGIDVFISKFSSSGSLDWSKTIGTSDNERAHSIANTMDGGFIIAGEVYAFGNNSNMYVVKLDANGNLEWDRSITGFSGGQNTHDIAYSVIQSSDGNYVVTGSLYSSTSSPPFGTFLYVLKLDQSGNLIWSKAIGGPHNPNFATFQTIGRSVIETSDGGLAIAGYTFAFGTGNNSMYLLKLDQNGNYEWSKTVGGAADDRAYSLIQTRDDGFVLAGETGSFAHGGGYSNMYIVKLNKSGSIEWTTSVGGQFARNDYAYSVTQNEDNSYLAVGFTTSFDNNVYIAKLNPDGSLMWSKTLGGNSSDIGTSVKKTSDGGYAIAGYTFSFTNSPSWPNMFIAKLDDDGNSCANLIERSSTVFSGGVNTSPTATVYDVNTTAFSLSGIVTNNGHVFDICMATNVNSYNSDIPDGFSLSQNYPNPFNPVTKINFEIPLNLKNKLVTLRVFNTLGQEVAELVNAELSPGTYEYTFDASGLSSGIYYYTLKTDNFIQSKKMILLK